VESGNWRRGIRQASIDHTHTGIISRGIVGEISFFKKDNEMLSLIQ